ncbi:MAG: ribose 5-phosphate isomerase B [Acidimicrobiia bacterium]
MKIAFGADHAGYRLKEELVEFARAQGHDVIDFGTDSDASVDYPDFASRVAEAVVSGDVDRGVLVCASGIGMSIAANKVRGIRAARVDTCAEAEFSRKHNDANVLCFGQRYIDSDEARKALSTWLETEFEGGRHQRRIDKIATIELEQSSEELK